MALIDNNTACFITGNQSTTDDIDLYIDQHNVANSCTLLMVGSKPKPTSQCPTLDPTASIQISDNIINIYQSRIDALINQLGKNVILQFNPKSEPCPNCLPSKFNQRSTGIYRPGGPRPFARGQKCPWCKHKGFIETSVEKCIKCLTQWNPRDAENYGIDISKNRGIVRLKTLINHLDDMMKARFAIVNKDIMGISKLKTKMIRRPYPVGLREDRYIVSFWELIDE